jgi:hypothetical protein
VISGKNENINVKCVTKYSKKCPIFAASKQIKQTHENQNYAHSRFGTGRFDSMQRRKTRKSNGTER